MKQIAIQAGINFCNFRKSLTNPTFKSAKRTAIQAAAEAATGFKQIMFFTEEDMKQIAKTIGGTYQPAKGGESKIVF